jgi:hypothetical protein
MDMRAVLCALIITALLLISCGWDNTDTDVGCETASLQLISDPANASVFVDDALSGIANGTSISVCSGTRLIRMISDTCETTFSASLAVGETVLDTIVFACAIDTSDTTGN